MDAKNANTNRQQLEDILAIKDFIALCLAKWRWFVISMFVCLACAALYIKVTPKIYTRQASVMIKSDANTRRGAISQQIADMGDIAGFSSSSDVQNEILCMQSPDIILETVKRLNLDYNYKKKSIICGKTLYGNNLPVHISISGLGDEQYVNVTLKQKGDNIVLKNLSYKKAGEEFSDNKEYTCKIGESVNTPVGAILVEGNANGQTAFDGEIEVTRTGYYSSTTKLLHKLSFSLSNKQASVINLTCNDEIPQRAEDVLNTIISAYNESWVRDKNMIAISTSEFIGERIKIIEQELGNVDSDISTFKSKNQMVDMAQANSHALGQTTSSESIVRNTTNELYMLNYIKDFIKKDATFRLLPAGIGISNPSIQSQISAYNTLVLQRNSFVQNSSEHNRIVVDLDKQLSSIRESILTSLDNEQVLMKKVIDAERGNISAYESKISQSPLQERELLSVERQQKVKEALYLFLLQKREENELSQAFTAYNTRIVSTPRGSMVPTSPSKKKVFALAFLLGLIIPICILYLRASLNTKVRGKADLNGLSVPYIGEIPLYKINLKQKHEDIGMQLVFDGESRKPINEAFRVARTNMEFMLNNIGGNKNVIMNTSMNPGSGKSFLIANLAASEAQKGKKVVIIDADMRRATISELVGKPAEGLSNYVAGFTDTCDAIPVEGKSGMFIIPVGAMPPNPTELLFYPRFEELINRLRSEYDYVFIDCPPVGIVADSNIIAKWADMTLFIVRSGLLERTMLTEIEQFYQEKKFNNMCLLLNATRESHGRYGYHYGYHYGYGYGYGNYYGKHKH